MTAMDLSGELFGIRYPADGLTSPCQDFADALATLREARHMAATGDPTYADAYLVFRPDWERLADWEVQKMAAERGLNVDV